MKRELENLDLIHSLYVENYRTWKLLNSVLIILGSMAIGCCSFSIYMSLRKNDAMSVIFNIALLALNIFMSIKAIMMSVVEYRDHKTEAELYERARQGMIALLELEEESGYEVELE